MTGAHISITSSALPWPCTPPAKRSRVKTRGATSALGAAAAALSSVGKFETTLRETAERASTLQAEAVELAADVAHELDAAEYDPAELDAINSRLDRIDRLTRKYGNTIDDVMSAAGRARDIVDEYEGREGRTAQLQADADAAMRGLRDAAASLRALRERAANALRKRVVAQFAEIALASGCFEVELEPLEHIGARGSERAEFHFAANAGEPARPLARVASAASSRACCSRSSSSWRARGIRTARWSSMRLMRESAARRRPPSAPQSVSWREAGRSFA